MKKFYRFEYWSIWGMGSNSDTALLTEKNLRKIIELELEKKNTGDWLGFDDRMTGTCMGEVFCDSADMEEVIQDVIHKRLTTCTTYAGVNDLIELPSHILIDEKEEKMKNTIFRLFNQYGFKRDIIVGETTFRRYLVDFGDEFERYQFRGRYNEFVSYDMRNVMENHYMYTVDDFIEMNRYKIERMERKLAGKKPRVKGRYIDDLLPGIFTSKEYRADIREARKWIEKFSNLPTGEDHYERFLYRKDSLFLNELYNELMQDSLREGKEIDHRKCVYDYPLFPDKFACVITNPDHADQYLRYDEMFKKGAALQYLMADWTNAVPAREEIGEVPAFWALRNVFAYD